MKFSDLANESRVLIEAGLRPLQGTRFQPTGFPNIGPVTYDAPSRGRMLLVESAQSMANRLEACCWDEGQGRLVPPLDGLPYVESVISDGVTTSSILEAHRLNSPYIVNSPEFEQQIKPAIGFAEQKPFDRRKLATALLRFDPNSLLHGIFLTNIAGVVRLPRIISAFIEADKAGDVVSGGVKFDHVQPNTGSTTAFGKADEGFGNVPFPRDESTAGTIIAFFNVDLTMLRNLGLPVEAQEMLLALAFYKIARFLDEGLRLRTACDLQLDGLRVMRPEGGSFPSRNELESRLKELIARCKPHFNDPPKLTVHFAKGQKKAKK